MDLRYPPEDGVSQAEEIPSAQFVPQPVPYSAGMYGCMDEEKVMEGMADDEMME